MTELIKTKPEHSTTFGCTAFFTCRGVLTAAPPVMSQCCLALLALTIFVMSGCGARNSVPPPTAEPPTAEPSTAQTTDDPKKALEIAIASREWSTAMMHAQQAMIAYPDDADVLTNAAIATAQTGDRIEAAQLLVEAVKASPDPTTGQRVENALTALLDVGRLYDSIELLRSVVRDHTDANEYRKNLVGFLGEAQLTKELAEQAEILIRQRDFDLPLLLATTDNSARRFSQNSIELMLKLNPQDERPRLGAAKQFLDRRNAKQSEIILREIIAQHPDFSPGHAMLGIALVAQGKREALPGWYQSLPDGMTGYAGYWVAIGDWALGEGNSEGAVRALAEATRRAPNESSYWAMLLTALRQWGVENPESGAIDVVAVSDAMILRQTNLLLLRDQFAAFKSGGQTSQSSALQIARTLADLGRLWESEAWLAIGTTLQEDLTDELKPYRDQVVAQLRKERDWQSLVGHPELSFDFSKFSRPENLLDRNTPDSIASKQPDLTDAKPIRMRYASEQESPVFYGSIGKKILGPRIPITQTLGCGGGIIDFDLDGYQDLIFAAAGGRIGRQDSDPGTLFRNQGSFVDVGGVTGFADPGYSHGIVVGDYNDDGFADILVLNLGPNRLFRNNGDGSFTDASQLLGAQEAGQWSTSGAILDVNQDGQNDIVVVNYCDSREPLEQPCFDANGQRINCYPVAYRAAADQILAGQADGTFVDTSKQWLAEAKTGRGLGIVAGRLDGQKQCVYIVNDASPNTFYRWQASEQKMVDQAIASGLAVDAQSLDQGSMGMASGDFDHDGDLDFYVTGFANEYNIFYEQQTPGFWSDRTANKDMVDKTLRLVGFGTEAIDLDNDGNVEIMVANGHVAVFQPPMPSYEQPIQVFQKSEDGRYQSLVIRTWGSYFNASHVGRGLFSGDLNNDGLCDAVITHVTEPVALLLNDSEPSNHRITFRLVDSKQNRDAVGAIVEFEFGDEASPRKHKLYQLAGHGYLSSNESLLWGGTGSHTKVRNARITWPDGEHQVIGDLESDVMYLLVREQSPYVLHRYNESLDISRSPVE